MKKRIIISTIVLILLLIITSIALFIYRNERKEENDNDNKTKSPYTIEAIESKDTSTETLFIGFLKNKQCFIMNLDNIIYKTKTKNVFIMEPLKEGYLTLDILKLQMNKEESPRGELYKYNGEGSIGTSRFSMFITDEIIIFANYDYKIIE